MRGIVALSVLMAFSLPLHAAEVVALGASNTSGRGIGKTADGVDSDQAFPADLERLLKAQKCDVAVSNAGIPGDTTESMSQRVASVVSSDTKVLILETPRGNDERKNVTNTSQNIAAIRAFARSHGIAVVSLGNWLSVAGIEHRQSDRQHFDAAGHLAMARYLLPSVRRAAGCRG